MRFARSTSLAAALSCLPLLVAAPALAQDVEVPQPSPAATVKQRVGLTDFTVEYSAPGVKGRQIWGALVPLNEPWRAGANAATKLTASRDFKFGDKAVKAGTYALYAIPGKDSWQLVLNSSSDNWGTYGLDKAKDVASITVKPEAIPHRERVTYLFTDTTDDGARLDLEWEKVRVSAPLKVDTKAQVMANLDRARAGAWRPHFTAARYALENGGDLNGALKDVQTSIAIKPTWWNNWVHAQILGKQGNKKEAVKAAGRAMELGKGDNTFESFFKPQVQQASAEWSKK